MNKCIIIIPIYNSSLKKSEVISLNQCLKILGKHPICFVTNNELNLENYLSITINYEIKYYFEYFDKIYFESIKGYNKLLLNSDFYYRFKKFDYILIHQLDAFIFRDELDYWCEQGYDYIGAPWFENFNSNEEGYSLWKVGNGGLSLRKVKKFIHTLSYHGPVYKPLYFKSKICLRKTSHIAHFLVYFIFQCFGYKNSVSYLLQKNENNEDIFWSSTFHQSWIKMKVAPIDIAIKFSFERSPNYLFSLNNKQLPFGCHAWEKYEYQEFWKSYINESK